MTTEYLAIESLPYLVYFAVIIAFLASITVGLGLAMSLFYLQAMMGTLKKFNANMDQAQLAFEKLNASTQQHLLSQVRVSETWHRERKRQLEEEEKEAAQENGGRNFPNFTQDWRTR